MNSRSPCFSQQLLPFSYTRHLQHLKRIDQEVSILPQFTLQYNCCIYSYPLSCSIQGSTQMNPSLYLLRLTSFSVAPTLSISVMRTLSGLRLSTMLNLYGRSLDYEAQRYPFRLELGSDSALWGICTLSESQVNATVVFSNEDLVQMDNILKDLMRTRLGS